MSALILPTLFEWGPPPRFRARSRLPQAFLLKGLREARIDADAEHAICGRWSGEMSGPATRERRVVTRGGGFEPPSAYAHRVSNPAPYRAGPSPLGRADEEAAHKTSGVRSPVARHTERGRQLYVGWGTSLSRGVRHRR